jgi:hypothetical protein
MVPFTELFRHTAYTSAPSLTSALDAGGWSMPHPCRFTPEKVPVPIVQEAGWDPWPVWMGAENLASPPGFDPRTVQPIADRYTVSAVPARRHVEYRPKCQPKVKTKQKYEWAFIY